MAMFLSPIKGTSKDPGHYPYRIALTKITGPNHELDEDILEGILHCEGDVGTFFQVTYGEITYDMAFSNAEDAMLYKLKFQK
jgi:hypothetical protein